MKFMQAKAVLFLMLLFLSLFVVAATKVNGVPVKIISKFVLNPEKVSRGYLYQYQGQYGGRYFVTNSSTATKRSCVLDNNEKCLGFDNYHEALNYHVKEFNTIYKDNTYIECVVDNRNLYIECEDKSEKTDDKTEEQPVTPPNTDSKPTPPNPNQCGRTIAGVWVPMPCTAPPASDDGSGSGGGSDSGGGGGDGSGSGGGSGGGSDSDGGGGSGDGDGSGGMDYIPPEQPPEQPPKQPECSPDDPSKNMCGGGVVVSHGSRISGFLTYSCRRKKGEYEYEYYNFWSIPSTISSSIEYCDGTAYVKSTDSGGNITINIYNNYNTADEAAKASSNDKDGDGLDDIYKIFDRDKDKNGNGSGGSGNGSNAAASSPSSPNGSGTSTGSNGSTSNSNSSASGVLGGQCEDGEDTLGCTPVGSQSDVNNAIDEAIGGIDGDFGIGEKEININTFKKGSDFVESGTCPPPKTIVILKNTHEISYQRFCDAALQIRPFVIFMAMFIAFTIVYVAILNKD